MTSIINLDPVGLSPLTAFVHDRIVGKGLHPVDIVTLTRSRFPDDSGFAAKLDATLLELHRRGELFPSSHDGGMQHRVLFKQKQDGANGCRVEVVCMNHQAPDNAFHIHPPEGELWRGVVVDGDPRFDGYPAGWGFFPGGSEHCPKVTGGTMILLYVWPEGVATFPRLQQ
ncbi:MAG: DUF4863 family protein [Bdellovibrionales bacterium]|nr:DUF4863 family protein [Bdellovibrionales bacterium]